MLLTACKKTEDRSCWKGHGAQSELVYDLDSVAHFDLGHRIKYRFYQDNSRQLIVKGGENMVNHIELSYDADTLHVNNKNRCNFLRDADRFIEVEIHYPYYRSLYIEPSDSVIFEDTITGSELRVHLREGGGSMIAHVNVGFLQLTASIGTANYTVSGTAGYAEIKVFNNGYANASELQSSSIFVYQNATGPVEVNLDNSNALIQIQSIGNVYYKGEPDSLELEGHGSGELIKL